MRLAQTAPNTTLFITRVKKRVNGRPVKASKFARYHQLRFDFRR